MKTLIKAVEVWLPASDGSLLEFGGGSYAAVPYFGAVSRAMCFGRGEGLPGRAWDVGHPVLLKQFEGSYFLRAIAAQEAGLTCAIAVPTYIGAKLSAVLVLFCGDDAQHAGAVELWRNDPRVTPDMTLDDGYYGTSSEALRTLTRDTYLPCGTGLPGLAWQQAEAASADDRARSSHFLRAQSVGVAGINRGLAMPCASADALRYVLTLLSSAENPIAVRIESWVPGDAGATVQRGYGLCEIAGALPVEVLPMERAGAVGLAFAECRPVINTALAAEPACISQSAAAARLTSLVAVPVVSGGQVSEVVALYF